MLKETTNEKEARIFNHYKKRLSEGGWTRFIVIEYLCQFPKINPYKMGASLLTDNIEIHFDDSSISAAENRKKENKVKKLLA